MRTLAEKRHNDVTKALRKRNICKYFYGWEYYDNLHQYSKNKIHCSCPLCKAKTNKSNWGTARKNWKHSDAKKIIKMKEEEVLYEEYNSNVGQ